MTAVELAKTLDMPREQWLELRRQGIGGSDAAAIVGLDRYRSPFDVYADKLGLKKEQPDNEAMRQGRDLEEYVASRFCEQTGKKVRRRNARLTKGGTRMLKLKKPRMPMPVTINDCLLLWQMGYEILCNDGKVVKVRKCR